MNTFWEISWKMEKGRLCLEDWKLVYLTQFHDLWKMVSQSVVLSTQMMQIGHSDIHSHHSLRGISGAFSIHSFAMKVVALLKMPLTQHTYAVCLIRTSENIHHDFSALRPPVSPKKEMLLLCLLTEQSHHWIHELQGNQRWWRKKVENCTKPTAPVPATRGSVPTPSATSAFSYNSSHFCNS